MLAPPQTGISLQDARKEPAKLLLTRANQTSAVSSFSLFIFVVVVVVVVLLLLLLLRRHLSTLVNEELFRSKLLRNKLLPVVTL